MLIRNFYEGDAENGRRRVAADIVWETCERGPDKVYFEIDPEHKDRLALNPDAFLLAAFIPAIKNREKRIKIEGAICAELALGIKRVEAFIRHWYYPDLPHRLSIESQTATIPMWSCGEGRSKGFFFSGGIDSLATLLRNREIFKPEHRNHIDCGITVFGLEMDQLEQLGPVEQRLERIAQGAGLQRVTLRTNVRVLDDNWQFWEYQWQGSVLASIAHVLARSLDCVFVASTIDYKYLKPYGSHPLIDPLLSSSYMRIVHDGLTMNRLEKVKLVSQYAYAINNLRCCNQSQHYDGDYVNCGKCEKCLRTMMALHVLGRLDTARCFRDPSVSAEKIDSLKPLSATSKIWWDEFAPLMQASDDADLREAVNRKVLKLPVSGNRQNHLRKFKKAIGVLDDKLLGRRLRKIKRDMEQV
jgi:hypothetical protein